MHRREQFRSRPGLFRRAFFGHRVSYGLLRTSTPATADEVERLRAHLAGVCNALNPDRSLTAHGGT